MFCVHTFRLVLRKTRSEKSRDYHDVIVFRCALKRKPGVFNSSDLKFRPRVGLAWTGGRPKGRN